MRRPLTLTIALLSLLALVPSALGTVGSYEVKACNYALDAVNNSWVWATTDPSQPPHFAEHANCPDEHGGIGGTVDQEGGLSTTDALGLSNGAPSATSAGWTFTAPPNTKITAIAYERYLGHTIDPSNYWSPALRADGTTVPGETCLDTIQNSETCFIGGPPGHGGEPGIITGLSAHRLTVGAVCQAPASEECITGATRHKVWAAIYGAAVTLSDLTPPTLSRPTGALWEPGALHGYHHGNENLTTTAQDIGGGLQSIVLSADGTPIQTYTTPCDYTFTQPCPLSTGPQTLTLPTTELSDGTHTLTLTATDAANNPSVAISREIAVDNVPPIPPTELTATATEPGGSTFTANWNDAGQDTPIAKATYQLCPSTSPEPCTTALPAPPAGPVTITVPHPGLWTLAVWLTDTAGLSDPTQAAHTTMTTPIPEPPEINHNQRSSGSLPAPGNSQPSAAHRPTAKLHLSTMQHGRQLVVRITGPPAGKVRVSYTGRYHHHVVASGVKFTWLRHGRAKVTFRLPPGLRAMIRVVARPQSPQVE